MTYPNIQPSSVYKRDWMVLCALALYPSVQISINCPRIRVYASSVPLLRPLLSPRSFMPYSNIQPFSIYKRNLRVLSLVAQQCYY